MPAWPRGRLTTYLPGSVPAISAADLDAIQDAIVNVNDCALFTPSVPPNDTPMAPFLDGAGRQRFTIDHNGLPIGGRLSYFREDWRFKMSYVGANVSDDHVYNALNSGQNIENPLWTFLANGGSAMTIATLDPGATVGGFSAQLARSVYTKILNADPGAVQNGTSIGTGLPLVAFQANTVFVLQFEAAAANTKKYVDQLIGFSVAGDLRGFSNGLGGAVNSIFFWRNGAVDNPSWAGVVNDNVNNEFSSGGTAVPATGDYQQFTLEVHGSATPYGVLAGNKQVARFFVDGVFIGQCSTRLPATNTALKFSINQAFNTGVSTPLADVYFAVGPLEAVWARRLTPASP